MLREIVRAAGTIAAVGLLLSWAQAAGAANTLVTIDPIALGTANVGQSASIAVPADGRPVMAYYDTTNADLKFVKCGNATCSSGNVVRTLDATNSVGSHAAVAVAGDGLPVIAYYAASSEWLGVGKCGTPDCSAFTVVGIERVGIAAGELSMAIGRDGSPVIAYRAAYGATRGLRVAKCQNAACTSSSRITVDGSSSAGSANSIAIGGDGVPIIAYGTYSPFTLRLARCSSAACTSAAHVLVDGTTDASQFMSVKAGADGLPLIAYYDADRYALNVAKCASASCSTIASITRVEAALGEYASLAIPADGLPVISSYDGADRGLAVTKCRNGACTGTSLSTTIDYGLAVANTSRHTGWFTSIAVGANGHPVIAYYDVAATALRFASCGTPSCTDIHTLSVTKAGSGSGTVTSSPAGINCGATCSVGAPDGAFVTLTATPAAGSTFAGWSGACSGAGTCFLEMKAEKAVTATFAGSATTHRVTVTKSGSGGGTVTSVPAAIDCGANCSASFASGTAVTLTASPDASSSFAGWSGACTGSGACTVTVNAAKAADARFVQQAAPVASPASIDFGGQSMGTTSPAVTTTLTNGSGRSISVGAVSVSGAQFAASHDCATLASGASCRIAVTFTPAAGPGALNSSSAVAGTLTATTDAGTVAISLAGAAEKSLVTHYYRSILRRAADAAGKAFWEAEASRVAALGANVSEGWVALAMSFITSGEYAALARDDAGYVTDLYNTFYNRAPDAGGVAYWTGLLGAGMPREIVLVSFMFSGEFIAFNRAIFGDIAARPEVDTVGDFYRGFLARLPDSAGFDYWVDEFRRAQCQGAGELYAKVEAISAAYAGSAEYAGRARTNAQFVGDLYNAFLRRGGDLEGVRYWIGELDSGRQTREQLRLQFKDSPEFGARIQAIVAAGCLS